MRGPDSGSTAFSRITLIRSAESWSVLGEKDEAFRFLEAAYQDGASPLIYLDVRPTFNNIRYDPRFADLRRRIGLPGGNGQSVEPTLCRVTGKLGRLWFRHSVEEIFRNAVIGRNGRKRTQNICAYGKYHRVRIATESTTSRSIPCGRLTHVEAGNIVTFGRKKPLKNRTESSVGTTVAQAFCGPPSRCTPK